MFRENFKGDSREVQGYPKEGQRVFQGNVKAVSKIFSGHFKGVSRKIVGIKVS